MTSIDALVSLVIGLLANLSTDEIQRRRENLRTQLVGAQISAPRAKPMRDQFGAAIIAMAKTWPASENEDLIRNALIDDELIRDITTWLISWDPYYKNIHAERVSERLKTLLERQDPCFSQKHPDIIAHFEVNNLAAIAECVFQDPKLSQFRLSLGLEELLQNQSTLEEALHTKSQLALTAVGSEARKTRKDINDLQNDLQRQWRRLETLVVQYAEEARAHVSYYSHETISTAISRFRELIIESCDSVDLANLPESDRHVALRSIYIPLRLHAERAEGVPISLEEQRDVERLQTAGRLQGLQASRLLPPDIPRVSLGTVLQQHQRIVVLGDPGAGKTTLLRWLSAALLSEATDAIDKPTLPDANTLPALELFPILIRCRDLDAAGIRGTLDEILTNTFRKAEIEVRLHEALIAGLRAKLAAGNAVLLVDGLDEVSDGQDRVALCQQVERISIAFPRARIVVTSRIVGYREMNYRLGREFQHFKLADLQQNEKDYFLDRWCKLTEPPERYLAAAEELKKSLTVSDRIQLLTNTPLLLTTLALVKRKVGKLPHRRADLYWETVQVLLNWRAEIDEPIDHREAIPQLEYLAYAMSVKGVQRFREDDIVQLWRRMREEYRNIRVLAQHTPEEFLSLLERRTALLVQVGIERKAGTQHLLYEFRHLTFQEYLAALAMIDGRWPGFRKSQTVAEQVRVLAGDVVRVSGSLRRIVVSENLREPLRLCVASCDDRVVDDVLESILGESASFDYCPRAILAASCLADDPNVSEGLAETVVAAYVGCIDDEDSLEDSFARAVAVQLADSRWADRVVSGLVSKFKVAAPSERASSGRMAAVIIGRKLSQEIDAGVDIDERLRESLIDGDEDEGIVASLGLMQLAKTNSRLWSGRMVQYLVSGLEQYSMACAHARAWATYWLIARRRYYATNEDAESLMEYCRRSEMDQEARYWMFKAREYVVGIASQEQHALGGPTPFEESLVRGGDGVTA
jgi:energy-coupling factor transporter ATP-binding protein EcfA2